MKAARPMRPARAAPERVAALLPDEAVMGVEEGEEEALAEVVPTDPAEVEAAVVWAAVVVVLA
jgi:hypothetical protein